VNSTLPDDSAYERLGEEALGRIAAALADLYYSLYEERPVDPRASLTGNMIAFVFSDGLSVADRWLLRSGREGSLRKFREQFFEVISAEMVTLVGDLTGLQVNYSFCGFDPKTRTTHAIFVLDLSALGDESEARRAVLNWSEQVRRNARRVSQESRVARQKHEGLRAEWRKRREEMNRAREGEAARRPPSADG
jgi:uncharacterized protein YbcI